MNLAPFLVTPLFAVRDGMIWLVLTAVMGARTARGLLQGRLAEERNAPVGTDGKPP